jgi:23S rRNA pseudouridine1911/1915/1917 synthase
MNEPDSEAAVAMKEFPVEPASAGMRLDQWLALALGPVFSRNRVQGLIRDGAVRIGGEPVREPKRKVAAGEVATVAVPEPKPAEPEGEPIPLDIVYEDDQLIVINKPPGLVVHPGAGNWTGTLVNALIHHCGASLSGIGGVRRPGIVHRLDKDTSGVMVAAKTDQAHRALSDTFANHGVAGDLERAYVAMVWGAPTRMTGTVDAPLGRSTRDRTRQAVVAETRDDARHAVTHFSVLERFGPKPDATAAASLLECRLATGRTHQIRVHMAHIGHPLIGDMDYGQAFRTKVNTLPEPLREMVKRFLRQALHARLLAFRHPATQEPMRFEVPMPDDMAHLVAQFRNM